MLATWSACTVLGVTALAFASGWLATLALVLSASVAVILHASSGRPRLAALLPPEAVVSNELRTLAEQIVAGDLAALHAQDQRARASRSFEALVRRQDNLEADRLGHHRRALERGTPIEDAQRIRGIGGGVTSSLRAHGISNLADLIRRRGSLQNVPHIGPVRASLLETWAHDRTEAIGRLLRAGSFAGRVDLDRQFDAQIEPLRRDAERMAAEANQARERLITWVDARRPLRERLESALRRRGVD